MENSLKLIRSCLNGRKQNKNMVLLIAKIDNEESLIDIVVKRLTETPNIPKLTLESVFEFVEEVNQYCKKRMTVDHIKQLWRLQ
jgi:hypothetical protein